MKKWLLSLVVCVGMALIAQPAYAQGVQFGGQVNWGDDADLGVGARGQFALGEMLGQEEDSPLRNLTGVVSLDYFFGPDCDPGDCSWIELNGNVLYPLEFGEGFAPYAGGGLNVTRFSFDYDGGDFGEVDGSETEVGLNVLGGANFDLGGFNAFGEGRFELGGGEQFVLTFGILVGDV